MKRESYQRDENGYTLAMRLIGAANRARRAAGETYGRCPECGQRITFDDLDAHFPRLPRCGEFLRELRSA